MPSIAGLPNSFSVNERSARWPVKIAAEERSQYAAGDGGAHLIGFKTEAHGLLPFVT